MQNIKWQRNVFQTFYAVMKIKVGGASVIEIEKGESFEYDGTILKYAGHEIQQPSVRGAISSGWATPNAEEVDDGVSAKAVARNIAKSQTRNSNLNRVERTAVEFSVTEVDEGQVADVSARRGQGLRDAPRKILTSSDASSEGTTVAILRTRSNLGPIDITRTHNLAKQLEDRNFEKPEYLNVEPEPTLSKRAMRVTREAESESETVGQVRQSRVKDADGVTLNHAKKGAAPVQAEASTNRTLEVKKPAMKVALSSNPKIRLAQRIYPDFPLDWNFEGRPVERVARVQAYSNDPEFLEAVYAAENDQGKKALSAAYPDLF